MGRYSHTVTSHSGFTRNTGRDKDDFGALESIADTLGTSVIAGDNALRVDMADISSNAYFSSVIAH